MTDRDRPAMAMRTIIAMRTVKVMRCMQLERHDSVHRHIEEGWLETTRQKRPTEDRMAFRLKSEHKALIEEAAAYSGESLTGFEVPTLVREAIEAIERRWGRRLVVPCGLRGSSSFAKIDVVGYLSA